MLQGVTNTESFGNPGEAVMMTRSEIFAERQALKRADKLFALSALSVTAIAAFILYFTVGVKAGDALARFLH
jgi:hypothetical protein